MDTESIRSWMGKEAIHIKMGAKRVVRVLRVPGVWEQPGRGHLQLGT